MVGYGTACRGLLEPGPPLLFRGCRERECLQEAQRELAPLSGGEDRADSPSEPAFARALGTVNGISGLASVSLGCSGLVSAHIQMPDWILESLGWNPHCPLKTAPSCGEVVAWRA